MRESVSLKGDVESSSEEPTTTTDERLEAKAADRPTYVATIADVSDALVRLWNVCGEDALADVVRDRRGPAEKVVARGEA